MTQRAGSESWAAFWAEVSGGRTETIRGVQVCVPTDLPMSLQARLGDLQDSEREEDLHELVALLFGDDVLAQWIDAGMGLRELQVVLAWGIAHGSGNPVSFREAYDRVQELAAGNVPGPNRAARRAAQKPRSAAGGGPSKRISSGSTGSGRRTSRG